MEQTTNQTLQGIRQSVDSARSIIERLYPVKSQRERVLKILAAAIGRANRVGPASWEVTLFPDFIRLNVGDGAVLSLHPKEIALTVTGRLMRAVPKEKRQAFKHITKCAFVPDAYAGSLPAHSLSTCQVLSAAHNDLIERAVHCRSISWWPNAHSPSVIGVLRDSGYELTNPTRAIRSQPSTSKRHRVLEDVDQLDNVTIEGRKRLRQHLVAERDPALVVRKKNIVLKAAGRLTCEMCAFDFEKAYGSLGENFAEAHHTIPLADFKRARKVSLKELAIVCSNCHRMLHRGDPVLTLTELEKRRRQARAARSSR